MTEQIILQKLEQLEKLITNQAILQKPVLNFQEATRYLEVSDSHLYKLTSRKEIPHFCPNGKKLYFKRDELDLWLQRNRQTTVAEIEQQASEYLLRNKQRK
jgi:excisionase family DNA binding protein